jgi:hypothetical protein
VQGACPESGPNNPTVDLWLKARAGESQGRRPTNSLAWQPSEEILRVGGACGHRLLEPTPRLCIIARNEAPGCVRDPDVEHRNGFAGCGSFLPPSPSASIVALLSKNFREAKHRSHVACRGSFFEQALRLVFFLAANRARPNSYENRATSGYLLTAALQATSADATFISLTGTPGTALGRWRSLEFAASRSQSVTISGEAVADG